MAIQVAVPGNETRFFNAQAEVAARESVLKYAEDLCKEAGRLEATARTAAGDPEITSSMVRDADLLLRRGYRQPHLRRGMFLLKVSTPVAAFVTGMLADIDKLKEPPWLIGFIALLTVTITLTVILASKESS